MVITSIRILPPHGRHGYDLRPLLSEVRPGNPPPSPQRHLVHLLAGPQPLISGTTALDTRLTAHLRTNQHIQGPGTTRCRRAGAEGRSGNLTASSTINQPQASSTAAHSLYFMAFSKGAVDINAIVKTTVSRRTDCGCTGAV